MNSKLIILISIFFFSKSLVAQESYDKIKKEGYINIIRLGTFEDPENLISSINMINGIRIGGVASIGIGIGYEKYTQTKMIPIYVDIRSTILSSRITPFVFLDIGDSFGKSEHGNNGWVDGATMYNIGLGIKSAISYSGSLFFEISYRVQAYTTYYQSFVRIKNQNGFFQESSEIKPKDNNLKAMMITIGASF